MRKLVLFLLSTIAVLMLWVVLVVLGTLEGWLHEPLAPAGDTRAFMDAAVDEGTDLQDAIGTVNQSPWQDLADFDALAGRNAHQSYLEREAAAFE